MSVVWVALAVLALPAAIGYCVVHLAVGRASLADELLGKIPAALALGVGLSSAATFLGMVASDRLHGTFELLLLAALLLAVWRAPSRRLAPVTWARLPRWAGALLVTALLAVIVIAILVFVTRVCHEPHGDWDAWDFWNMRARFFVRAGADWEGAYSEHLYWAHPSYPPMLSTAVARGFRVVGAESIWVPVLLGTVFTTAMPCLLGWTVYRVRGPAAALIATLTLVSTAFFMIHSPSQYADVPLAFFFLATFAFTALHDAEPRSRGGFLVLAGLSAALAALTKNEGNLFMVCFVVGRGGVLLARGGRPALQRDAFLFGAGAIGVGLLELVFKLGYSHMPISGEFYVGRWFGRDHGALDHVVEQLSDGPRWEGFAESWYGKLTTFDQSATVPLVYGLLGYGLLMGRSAQRPSRTLRTMVATFAIQATAVSFLFLAWSTLDIREHMDALFRLLYHVMPSAILAVFLAVRAPFEHDPRVVRRDVDPAATSGGATAEAGAAA